MRNAIDVRDTNDFSIGFKHHESEIKNDDAIVCFQSGRTAEQRDLRNLPAFDAELTWTNW